ncbi:hypothetical protein N7508_003526 [Penicillium antarcticum]|uniref:uncharacterized protein n=1 Tax=Penicillium antarcticum TaxID=416450 RepID=UPI00239653B7|nr:uncharacterized protein N7508_003526 [Penicillium antarcticum]KAJ5312696.1 hypothetical protein N7508_003526 [Penicillium antarcticum]
MEDTIQSTSEIQLKIPLQDTSQLRRWRLFHGMACERQRVRLSSDYVVQLLDAFSHKGPNGVHQCLVLELLCPSIDKVLSDYYESHDKLHPETVLRIPMQLLKAIKSI